MELKDFMDLSKLQKIQDDFSNATGLAAIAVGKHGEYLTEGSNFTDFCMKYTRGSSEGNRRCVKCDNECSGTYFCHAGLMDFSIDIIINDEKLGSIIGGQVLPAEPDEEKFRQTAQELGIDPDKYIQALHKVPVSSEKRIRAASNLLGIVVNQLVNLEYFKYNNAGRLESVRENVKKSGELVEQINENTGHLKGIAKKQTILSLNATIEAARSGEAGVGFAVVAKSMQELSSQSSGIYNDIEKSVSEITALINMITSLFHDMD
ncbi:MAG: chemotaxis protein [Lachnospiraceae bacterium]|jgi:ligand-binding sensor protein|nr:chemotaxis protein [Lachnospiraceae bacterium]MCX4380074.1 PocR ligand-binding domain-containing protein [Lachnospiraceae bacterium]